MPELVAASPASSCFLLLSGTEIKESQSLEPDRSLPRAQARARKRHDRLEPGGAVPLPRPPSSMSLSVDRLTFGNVRETFAKFIRNGETVVTVRAATDTAAAFAADNLCQYSPITLVSSPPAPKCVRTGSRVQCH